MSSSSSSSSFPSPAAMWPRPAGKHRSGGGGAAAAVRRAQLVLSQSRDVGWCGQRAWRKLLRRLAQETKCICTSPTAAAASRPITSFGYDAVSYAKNFDDGRGRVPAPCAAPVVAAANAADKSIDN